MGPKEDGSGGPNRAFLSYKGVSVYAEGLESENWDHTWYLVTLGPCRTPEECICNDVCRNVADVRFLWPGLSESCAELRDLWRETSRQERATRMRFVLAHGIDMGKVKPRYPVTVVETAAGSTATPSRLVVRRVCKAEALEGNLQQALCKWLYDWGPAGKMSVGEALLEMGHDRWQAHAIMEIGKGEPQPNDPDPARLQMDLGVNLLEGVRSWGLLK